MKKAGGFIKRIVTIFLSSMLVAGTIPGTALAAEVQETTVQEEEAITTYTVTLDANGGYFVNEWDDVIGEYIESTEILNKQIPVGETVTTVPVFETDDQHTQAMIFSGWSLERDGEPLFQGDEEYAPVDNCVLYAVWNSVEDENLEDIDNQNMESFDESSAQTEASEADTMQESEDSEVKEDKNENTDQQDDEPEQVTISTKKNVQKETVSEGSAKGVVERGTCGENITWTLDGEGTLIISGTGDMYDYDEGSSPLAGGTASIVQVEDGVTSIGDYAFYTSSISNVSLPQSIKRIGIGAFEFCTVEKINIPNGLEILGAAAFFRCFELESIIIPSSVKRIESQAFQNSGLKDVIIEEGVTEIGVWAFEECRSLCSITIPEGIISIEEGAFSECDDLVEIAIPSSVEMLGDSVFSSCNSLKSVSIPSSLTSTGDNTFSGCYNLESVIIEEGVKIIGAGAFSGCHSLCSIILPSSVTNIESQAFYECALQSIDIPNEVTAIGVKAFMYCGSLQNITIPSSVTDIGDSAFKGCGGLTSVNIEEGVKNLGKYVFQYCNVKSISIPSSLETMGEGAFENCPFIDSIFLSDIATWINNCRELRLQRYKLLQLDQTVDLYLNDELISNIVVPSSVTRIDSYCFNYCNELVSIIIPSNVTRLNSDAFCGCDNLKHIYYGGTEEEWKALGVSFGDSITIHYGYEQNDTSLKLKDKYECETNTDFIISAQIISKKLAPSLSNTNWTIVGLDQDKYEWGSIVSVAPQENNQYVVSRFLNIKEEGTYSLTVSFNGADDSAKIIATPKACVKFTKFKVGLNRKLIVCWEKEIEGVELSGYEIEYGVADSNTTIRKSVHGEGCKYINLGSLEADGEYEFRVRGVKKDLSYTEWCPKVKCPIHAVKLLASPNECMDLVGMPILIDFGENISLTEKGCARLINSLNVVVQETDLSYSDSGIDHLVSTYGSYLTFILNNKAYRYNPLNKNSQYSIEMDSETIEYLDSEGEAFNVPVYFNGIKKGEWEVQTSPMLYSKATNPTKLIIPDEYYKDLYSPSHWKKIKNLDNGFNGLCFGLSYAAIAYKQQYPNIQKALRGEAIDNCGVSDQEFLEYIQRTQIYQYRPECQNIAVGQNENNFAGLYDDISCGVDVIIGVKGDEGEHAIVPIKILREDASKVEIAVYDCNNFGDRNLVEQGYTGALSTFTQILTLYKNSNGDFSGYHYPNFDKRLIYQVVGEEIDGMSRTTGKEYLIASSKPIGGMQELTSLNGKGEGTQEYLYWCNEDSFSYLGTDENKPCKIWFSDGKTSVSFESDKDRSVYFDFSTENLISVEGLDANDGNNDNYIITISNAEDYENEDSILISGKGSEYVSVKNDEEGVIVDNPLESLINVSVYHNSEVQDSKYIKCEGNRILLETSDNEIKASSDSDGDGEYELLLNTITNIVETIEIINSDMVLNCGENAFVDVSVFPENADNRKLAWQSSNPQVADINEEGLLTAFSKGNTTITATATDGSGVHATCLVTVNPFSLKDSVVSDTQAMTYTGKAITQPFVVKYGDTTLIENTDYTVSYSNNTNAGTATITITGIGNYAGTKTATFKINKANQSITAKVSSSSIAVGKTSTVSITGAKGTKSFKSSDTSVAVVNTSTGVVTGKKAGTVTITATSAATSNYNAASKTVKITVTAGKTLKKPGNCHFAKWNNAKYTSCQIAWNKVAGADGYQTLLSWTNGTHASSTIVKSNVLYRNCTVHPQHVSQMKVRAFYNEGGKRVFGPWSNIEYITPSPAKLTAKNTSSGSNLKMNISWNIIYGCNGYNVFITTNPNGKWYWNQSTSEKATATSATIDKCGGAKLKKNTRYYVRIVTRRKRNGVFCTVPMPAKNTYVGSFIIK